MDGQLSGAVSLRVCALRLDQKGRPADARGLPAEPAPTIVAAAGPAARLYQADVDHLHRTAGALPHAGRRAERR